MKKQELIHLHGLLAEVSSHLDAEPTGDKSNEGYHRYRGLGVRPTSIHRSKTSHKQAVFALANGINISTGKTEGLSEKVEDVLEQDSPDPGEAYRILAGHAVSRAGEAGKQAVVELTEEIYDSLGPEPEHVLSRLDGSYIDAGGDYGIGDEVRLKV